MKGKQIRIKVCGMDITLTHDADGIITAEMCRNNRYFVMTGDKDGKLYTQENLTDGNIVDLYKDDNLCEALEHLALADTKTSQYFICN